MSPLPVVRIVTAATLALFAAPALAQGDCPKGRCTELDATASASNFGDAVLDADARTDTVALPGRSGGDVDASYLGGSCEGFATNQPDHVLTLSDAFDDLELRVEAEGDVALVVHGPDGWQCAPASRSPSIRGDMGPGTYRVWVASARIDRWFDYDLFAESHDAPAYAGNQTLDAAASVPSRQQMVLGPNEPPTQEREATAGGPVDASYLGRTATGPCVGFAGVDPAHMFTLTERRTDVDVRVDAVSDLTLIVHGPGGWMCNDDADGYLPVISGDMAPGTYRVWVGTYRPGESARYRLAVSRVGDDVLPPPPPPPPSSLLFVGRFEQQDVSFSGRDADEVFSACRTFGASSDAFDWVDEVTIDGATWRTSGYWEADQLCALAALNAAPTHAPGPPTVSGTIEDAPFAIWGSRSAVERTARSYLPYLDDGWVDDVTVNGQAMRNGPGYWSGEALVTIVLGGVVDPGAAFIATGTMEDTPFTFSADTPEGIRDQCMAFFASAMADEWVDDIVVNGTARHNTYEWWSAPDACMIVTTLATGR